MSGAPAESGAESVTESDQEEAISAHLAALSTMETMVDGIRRKSDIALHNIAELDEMGCSSAPRLPVFDHFALVGISSVDGAAILQAPQMLHHWTHPGDCYAHRRVPSFPSEMVPHFCFPKGVVVNSIKRSPSLSALDEVVLQRPHVQASSHSFVFRMTNECGDPSYGFCLLCDEAVADPPTFVQPRPDASNSGPVYTAPVCYCLITRRPQANLLFRILFTITAHEHLRRTTARSAPQGAAPSAQLGEGRKVLHDVLQHAITISDQLGTVTFELPTTPIPSKIQVALPDPPGGLAEWSFLLTARALSLRNLLHLFAFALMEKQMVFISSELGLLSASVSALEAIIYPMSWQGLLAPVLPEKMHGFIDAPVPFAVGMQSAVKKLRSADRVHVFLDYDEVTAPEGCSSYLPKWSQMFTVLDVPYKKLRKLALSTPQPLSNPSLMAEAAPLVQETLGLMQTYNRWATEVGFMMERTKNNMFGELANAETTPVDPFFAAFLTTQAWAVYRDETLMTARVPMSALTPRSREERAQFERARAKRMAKNDGLEQMDDTP